MTVLESFAGALASVPAASQAGTIGERLRLHFADTIAALGAGARSVEGLAIARQTGAPALFGAGLTDRIALRVAQTRLTEIDDIHMGSCTTAGSVVVPVALLLSAEIGVDSAALQAGMRAGYDAMVRLGVAIDGARILYRGVWPTFFTAPVAAAACASAILGLDASRTAHALALALTQISGAAGGPAPGRNPRWLLAGWSAAAGVRAALAARDGFGGDTRLLDGDWLLQTHGVALDPRGLEAPPGSAILEMSLKPWCTAKQAAAALAGFIELLDEGLDPARIERVAIYVPPAYRGMIAHRPPGRIGRIVSIAWQCALAVYHRDALYDIERSEFAHEPEFSALLAKIEIFADPELDRFFPGAYPARVETFETGGERRERLVRDAPGDPSRPLDATALGEKYARVGGSTRDLFHQALGLGDTPASIRELCAALA